MPKQKVRTIPSCHPDRRHDARGMCGSCYGMWLYRKDKEYIQARNSRYRESRREDLALKTTCKTYGISPEEYHRLHEAHGGLCAICGMPETAKSRGSNHARKLSIDHCHSTGRIRGLLCAACNVGIGSFKDSQEIIMKAIDYIRRSRQHEQTHSA